jgi:hypothetical protein
VAEGTTLGPRDYYKYTADDGNDYQVLADSSNAQAMGGVVVANGVDLPRRCKPRGVFVQDDGGSRKFLVAFTQAHPSYQSMQSTSVTIKGETWKTTGRKGETKVFGVTKPVGPPAP